jgi:tRNA(Ile)-lysidine synthase
LPASADSLPGAERVRFEEEGIRLPRTACTPRLIAIASVCMGGGETLPRRESARQLAGRVAKGEAFTATLAGARIIAAAKAVTFIREVGEANRGGLAPITAPGIWDGRYDIGGEGEVRAVAGLAKRLPDDQRQKLATLPAATRPGLPVIVQGDLVTCPILATSPDVPVERLWPGRFLTASGLYAHESDLRQRLR